MAKRYLIIISYDGSLFHGYQRQPRQRTVQGELEKVLTRLNNRQQVFVHGSGRTDALVHAIKQYVHFDLDITISLYALKRALNSHLPGDIHVLDIKEVKPDFHARYDVLLKEYVYKLNMGEYNPVERQYVYQYNKELNVEAMKKGISYLIGTHDFISFAAQKDLKENTIRTIKKASIEQQHHYLIFHFMGDGFLKYQVRNMVGLLIEIGANKKKPEEVHLVIQTQNRTKASKTANAEGLYLKECIYKDM